MPPLGQAIAPGSDKMAAEQANQEALAELAAILTAETGPEEKSWSRRFKGYREEVHSGNPRRIAAVVRNLLRRQDHAHLSQGEKELLRDASAPLVAEVVLAAACSEEQARHVILRLVLEESRDVLHELPAAS